MDDQTFDQAFRGKGDGPSDADALFARLQELVDELPDAEKRGLALARARAARDVIAKERYLRGQERELARIDDDFAAASAAAEIARKAGDVQAEQRHRARMLLAGNRRGVRAGAVGDARLKYERACVQGGFADVDDARAFALADDEFNELEASVEAFKRDYAATLEACQRIEGEEMD